MSKRSRKSRRFPREEPPTTTLRHEVDEKKPIHSADVVVDVEVQSTPTEDNLQMNIIKKREWMAANQFSLTPQEREKKWDEIRALEGKLRSRA